MESMRAEAQRRREAVLGLEKKLREERAALLVAETRLTQLTQMPVSERAQTAGTPFAGDCQPLISTLLQFDESMY